MSIGQYSAFETTPVEVTLQAAGSIMTSSSSRGIGFYFQCAILVVGVLGVAANGLILYAMVVSKQHRKHVLVFNQNALDLVIELLVLTATTSLEMSDLYLSGTVGYWLCQTLTSYAGSSAALIASQINLAAIRIGR